jgi:hypothetical protein
MKKIIMLLSLIACASVTGCANDPASQDLKSPCVSIDHPNSPCIRKTPVENAIV